MRRQVAQDFQQDSSQESPQDLSKDFMALAMERAREAASLGEVPVAALVVDAEGRQLALCQNRIERDRDPTAHAELLAIRESLRTRQRTKVSTWDKGQGRWLEGCSLYVTLEPCAMCAAAILHARLRRLYFAAYDPKGGAVEHGATLLGEALMQERIEVYGGIRETEARKVLQEFFRARRG